MSVLTFSAYISRFKESQRKKTKNVRTASSLISENIITFSQSMNTGDTYRYFAALHIYFECAIKHSFLFVLKLCRDKFDNSLTMWNNNSSNQRNLTQQSSLMTINSCWQFVFFLSEIFCCCRCRATIYRSEYCRRVYLRIV